MISALLLSRIQFGLSLGVHFIFPALTLGLTLYVIIYESAFVVTRKQVYGDISIFLVKLLSLIFTLGVATGILLPFSFGTNWAKFSVFSGSLFGMQLAIEALTAFAIESIGIAILLFGRRLVPRQIYLLSAVAVFLAAHLSAFWIISANSWMQTPAGYAIHNGAIALSSFSAAIFNPSAMVRFTHTVFAAWLTGSAAVCSIAAYYLVRNRHGEIAKKLLRLGLPLLTVTAVLQPVVGHDHIMKVIETQPIKDAAYEGTFFTRNGAPLYLFGIPDEKAQKIRFGIAIPYLLSFLESGRFNSEVVGLDRFQGRELPPVNVIFTTFHAMVGIGFILIGAGVIGLFLLVRRRLFTARLFLIALQLVVLLPLAANELGWIGAEVGRQPWIVYGLLRTDAAASAAVRGSHVLMTFSLLSAVYLVLLWSFFFFGRRILRQSLPTSAQQGGRQ